MHLFKKTNFDFLRWRWYAIGLSWVIIIAGIVVIATKGLPLGIEFAGGTTVIAKFDREPSIEQVRAALDRTFGGQNIIVQTYGDPSQRQVMTRVPEVGAEAGAGLSTTVDKVRTALTQANLGNFTVVGTEVVGPAVGQELRSKGLSATVLSLAGILLYITFRYQFSFAVGAVVATLHDLLVTLAFLAFFRYDLSLNVIAAILTVAGYSTNDTIVIFDRVRENLRGMRRDTLNHVVNASVNQTLGRTVITGGLTLLSVIALFLFGGEVLRGFAFTMIVGIITGTYSSVLHRRRGRDVLARQGTDQGRVENVIFDRVRETLRGMRRDTLNHVVNASVNQTLGRTVITGGLTLLSVIALFLFGGEVLRGFAFTMIVGIITGTYSSVFVAAAVVTFWRGKGPTRAASHAPATASVPAPQQPARKSKPQRKARAS